MVNIDFGLLFFGVLPALMVTVFIAQSIKNRKLARNRKTVLDNGTFFEAYVIGVTQGDMDGHSWANLKISYMHPYTKQQTIVYSSLGSEYFTDDRIYRFGLPSLSRITKSTISSWKYNQKLYTTYRHNVEARNISPEEKKQLLKEAMKAMSVQYEHPPKDHEGYIILNPPILAEGYMLVDEIVFLQKTNTPILSDWTRNLK